MYSGAALGGEPISHPRPGGAQLRGDDLRHPSRVPLATLSLSNDRRNDVVLADRKKGVELTRARRRFLRAGAADRELEGEKKGGCTDPLEEGAPARLTWRWRSLSVFVRCSWPHAHCCPENFEASAIAARIRG